MAARWRNLVILFICLGVTSLAWGYGVENNAGLRFAERIDSRTVRLYFGPGMGTHKLSEKAGVFQIVSPTDKMFQKGVAVEYVKLVGGEPDTKYPAGWNGPKFDNVIIEIRLPENRKMDKKHRYWIRIMSAWLIARNNSACWIESKSKMESADMKGRYGLRELYAVSPNTLHVITGAGIDISRLSDMSCISITSKDDSDFAEGTSPLRIGRRSNLDFYVAAGWPWKFNQRHELFLVLPKLLKEGKNYKINLNSKAGSPVTCGSPEKEFVFSCRETINLSIKVNQLGYQPANDVKYGYMGMWMGDLNAADFSGVESFEVRNAKTHAKILSGKPVLRNKATYKLESGKLNPDPSKVKGPETVYNQDLSYEDVYQLDLSSLKTPGAYYVAIPGYGRSFEFKIADDVYDEAFDIIMNGIFHQRCGIELKDPYTRHYRPACHRNSTEWSTFKRDVDRDPWKKLPDFATDGVKHDVCGGHHDAGDWNPRAHLEVAEILFLLYELNPKAFRDGQLNIPESKNGLPDILDEAYWALKVWFPLQDEDGGVRNGIESAGDPHEGDSAANDSLREFAFAKDAKGSYWFAAVAAQASILWGQNGRADEAKEFLERAVRAWNWAEKNGGDKEHDMHVFAASMLLRATGEDKYKRAFAAHSVYSSKPDSVPVQHGKYDQRFGSFYYALAEKADEKLKANIVKSFESEFSAWRRAAETTSYRYMRSPYSPNTWGTGGLPKWPIAPAMTMALSKNTAVKKDARQWLSFTNDFSLGCHPMNLVFTVGLGDRYVTHAWHHLMEQSPEGIIPGLQSEAAGGRFTAGERPAKGGMGGWAGMSMHPAGQWPDLYKFSEDASPGMNEGVVVTQVRAALAYGLFVAGTKDK